MPSLEIICINQQEVSDFSQLPFIVEAAKELVSLRTPARFQVDFDKLSGCIYHLFDGYSPTCYDLLVRDWYDSEGKSNGRDENVVFRDEYAAALQRLLEELLLSSPVGQILFTTDYQFGPEVTQRFNLMPFVEFQEIYNAGNVRMNASYLVTTS